MLEYLLYLLPVTELINPILNKWSSIKHFKCHDALDKKINYTGWK